MTQQHHGTPHPGSGADGMFHHNHQLRRSTSPPRPGSSSPGPGTSPPFLHDLYGSPNFLVGSASATTGLPPPDISNMFVRQFIQQQRVSSILLQQQQQQQGVVGSSNLLPVTQIHALPPPPHHPHLSHVIHPAFSAVGDVLARNLATSAGSGNSNSSSSSPQSQNQNQNQLPNFNLLMAATATYYLNRLVLLVFFCFFFFSRKLPLTSSRM